MMTTESPLPPDEGIERNRPPATGGSRGFFEVLRTVAMLCVLGLFALVVWHYSPFNPNLEGAGDKHPAVGKTLSGIELQPLTGSGDPVTEANLQGKVVLLNFWGAWCPPCRQEFPHLMTIVDRYASRPEFRFLSVSCGAGIDEDVDQLRSETTAFLEKQRTTLQTYHDAGAATRQAVDRTAGFQGYPTTILLDGKGVIRGMWTGYYPGVEKEIDRAIAKLLP